MKTIIVAVAAWAIGAALGFFLAWATVRYLRRRIRDLRRELSGERKRGKMGTMDKILVLEDGTRVSMGLGGYLDIGLMDTMKDLLVNLIGAVVFSGFGYVYVKTRGEGRIARMFIPQVSEEEKEE